MNRDGRLLGETPAMPRPARSPGHALLAPPWRPLHVGRRAPHGGTSMSRSDVTALSSKARLATPAGEVHPGLPPVLAQLLSARDEDGRAAAWTAFLAAHSRLLLHVCNTLARDHDAAMDGYAYILDAL